MDHNAGFPTRSTLETQLLQLQEELKSVNEKFLTLFTGNPQPMLVYDVETLRFLDVNEAAINLYGYTREEFLQMDILRIRPPEDVPKLLSHILSPGIRAGNEVWKHFKKNGELMFVNITSHEIFYESRAARHIMVSDITEIKMAQLALAESEEWIRTTLDTMMEGCQILGFDLTYKYLNDAALRQSKAKRSQLNGRKFTEVWPGIEKTKLYKFIIQCLDKREHYQFDNEFTYPDGTKGWFSLSIQPVPEGVFILSIDITKRKQTEKSLKQSELKFRNLFHQHAAVKLIIDAETGMIADANKAASEFYGWSHEELVGMNIDEINTLSRSQIKLAIQKVIAKKKNHFSFTHRTKSGALKHVEVASSMIMINCRQHLHSIVQDVTEKMIAEKKVKLLSKSIEQSPVGILITGPDGFVEFCNTRFTELTGYSLDEVRGNTSILLNNKHSSGEVWDTLKSGQTWRAEFNDTKKNGETYWANVVIAPMLDSHGTIINFIMVYEDISDQKKLVAELLKAKLKAEESDRLKTSFLANMSHEIRTPMNGILGFIQLLQEPELPLEEREEYNRLMQISSQRLMDTITGIIDISKIESGSVMITRTSFDLHSLILDTVNFFAPEAARRKITLTIGALPPFTERMIITDRFKVESILINLIKNALKFTPSGSITVTATVAKDQLRLTVKDTGCGIPAEKLLSIFDRFVQADSSINRSHEGSGLGLPISRAYAELLGGMLTVQSQPGEGAVFTLLLPLGEW
jgi:PAS domain S-box-containing protein